MATIDVIGTPNWAPGAPEKRGEIDDTGLIVTGETRAVLRGAACEQLLAMLGDGYGGKHFHLVRDGRLLKSCRIVRNTSGVSLELSHEGEVAAP